MTTEELINKQKFWTKRKLQRYKKGDMFKSDTENANLNENTKFIYECKWRIQGYYPVYLPSKTLLTENLIFHPHLKTINGVLTVKQWQSEKITWIPGLKQQTKKVVCKCRECKTIHDTLKCLLGCVVNGFTFMALTEYFQITFYFQRWLEQCQTTTLPFSTSIFTTLGNVETTLWIWPYEKNKT